MNVPDWVAIALQAAALWAGLFAVALVVYFTVGLWLHRLNGRHPERRIQRRSGEHRIRREIRSSIGALAISSGMQAGGFFALLQGWTLFPPIPVTWWSVPLALAALVIAYDAWFYFAHRLLHTRWLYRFHAPHHMSLAPTAWSNDSSSSLDTAITHAFFLIAPIVFPAPLVLHYAHRLFDQVTGMIGHAGFEHFAAPSTRWPSPMICTLFHDQHHSSFSTNYGNTFSFWDRVLGTIHPDYDERAQEMEQRLRRPAGPGPAEQDRAAAAGKAT